MVSMTLSSEMWSGSGSWTRRPVDARVGVQAADRAQNVVLRGGGHSDYLGDHSGFGGGAFLVSDVHGGRRVVADQDDGKPGDDAALGAYFGDPRGDFLAYLLGHRRTAYYLGGHKETPVVGNESRLRESDFAEDIIHRQRVYNNGANPCKEARMC